MLSGIRCCVVERSSVTAMHDFVCKPCLRLYGDIARGSRAHWGHIDQTELFQFSVSQTTVTQNVASLCCCGVSNSSLAKRKGAVRHIHACLRMPPAPLLLDCYTFQYEVAQATGRALWQPQDLVWSCHVPHTQQSCHIDPKNETIFQCFGRLILESSPLCSCRSSDWYGCNVLMSLSPFTSL